MGRALITGATAGLGREYAEQLAAGGSALVLVARDGARLEEVAATLRTAHGVEVEPLPADLADPEQLRRVAQRVSSSERPVDLLVNNAGFGQQRDFLRNDLAEEERAVHLMVGAVMVLCHAAGRVMRERGHGGILNVSSVAGFTAMGHYSAIKAYVTVLTEGLATELAGSGVHVTAVCPGFTRTEFHERAGMDMSRLPESLWLDAADVVRESLEAVRRGRVVSVPSAPYKGLVALLRVAPRRLTRRAAGALSTRRRGPARG
ncbi:SDR family NAD(P)-dependent oxidoreductase [Ornithinimicrobium cerasi]|uniref:SDR family NAD(P)-dependent oxidoreductase n=1 Tax=Ornithinimicrobium cerasi TaxID=2248773 RepID=UPI000EFEBD49|nr:SDR family oxidoreductase [Ornithinimicrobium cerasi]